YYGPQVGIHMTHSREVVRYMKRTLLAIAALALVFVCAYASIMWEGSSTRGEAPAFERVVAGWLLKRTVPGQERDARNPLRSHPVPADAAARLEVYRQKCEICHGYDGSGRTEIASGQYPRPPDLRGPGVQALTDGELLFHITNGIRHTGMPAWSLPARRGW